MQRAAEELAGPTKHPREKRADTSKVDRYHSTHSAQNKDPQKIKPIPAVDELV